MMRQRLLLALVATLVLAGCQRGPSMPAVVPVKGKVLLPGGEPLRGGRLNFLPKNPAGLGGIEPFADIGQDGTFSVTTYQENDGAIPGTYVVTITPVNFKAKGGNPVRLPNAAQIPNKYLEEATSDLTADIKGEATDLTLQLR
jgi:hypothetical protein